MPLFCLTGTQLKGKWKQLCGIFKKDLSQLPRLPSGSGATNVVSAWIHFDSMKFLTNIANRPSSGNITDLVRSMDDNQGQDVVNDSDASPMPSTSTASPVQSTSKPATKSIQQPSSLDESDELFLASLMPYVRSIKNPKLKLKFRTDANAMLFNFIYDSQSEEPQVEEKSNDGNIFLITYYSQSFCKLLIIFFLHQMSAWL